MKKQMVSVLFKGNVIWSDKYAQKERDKNIHAYLMEVVEEFDGKKIKHVFNLKAFNKKDKDMLFVKGDEVKGKGFLKKSSYKKDGDWIEQVYIQITEISLDI